jgi:hypothetical protein
MATLTRGTTIFETKVTCLLSIGLREFLVPLQAGNRSGLNVWKFCRGKAGNHPSGALVTQQWS